MDQTNSASVTRVIRRVYCINLPTLQDDDTIIRHHYKVWCKWKRNMSRSIANRTPYNDHVCCSCVHPSLTARHLRRHEPHSMQFPPQMVKYLYPDGHTEDLIVKFHTRKKQTSVVFLSRVQLYGCKCSRFTNNSGSKGGLIYRCTSSLTLSSLVSCVAAIYALPVCQQRDGTSAHSVETAVTVTMVT